MGVSLYSTLERDTPLSSGEEANVQGVLSLYDLDRYVDSEVGGESFSFYEETEPGEVLSGSVGITLDSEQMTEEALRYWCRLLAQLRQTISGGTWDVHLEDNELAWDKDQQAFWFPESS